MKLKKYEATIADSSTHMPIETKTFEADGIMTALAAMAKYVKGSDRYVASYYEVK